MNEAYKSSGVVAWRTVTWTPDLIDRYEMTCSWIR